MKKLIPALAGILLLLSGCGAVDVTEYSGTEPRLDLREFFSGELRAYGMLQDRSGRVTRRFTATLQGSWDGDSGTLAESFRFDDGEVQQRVWQLEHDGRGNYRGSAGDVVGTATGSTGGAVFNWKYRLDVPYRDDSIVVSIDDWMYLIDERHLLNRSELTKFGFSVGELTLLIEKL